MHQLNETSNSSLSPLLSMPFCGSEFWNSNLTWYTESPYFTRCFQSTVLVYLPSFVFLLLSPLDISNYIKSENREVPWGPRLKARLGINIIIAGISLAELVLAVLDLNAELATVFSSDALAAIIKTLTFLLSSSLLLTSKHFGQVNSGTQFFFWLSSCFCQGLTVGSLVISRTSTDVEGIRDVYEILYSCSLALSLVMFLLNFFADDQPLYSDLMRK
jgi:ATP-binding cassette subfamily C (CFTR/MRP) protein 1